MRVACHLWVEEKVLVYTHSQVKEGAALTQHMRSTAELRDKPRWIPTSLLIKGLPASSAWQLNQSNLSMSGWPACFEEPSVWVLLIDSKYNRIAAEVLD